MIERKEIGGVKEKRGSIVWDSLMPWIIGIVVLVVSFVLYETLSEKGTGLIEFFRQLVSSR